MTPAEHVAEAGRLIAVARGDFGDRYRDDSTPPLLLAEAQVHATLATVPPSSLAPRQPSTAPPCDEQAVTGEQCLLRANHSGQHVMGVAR